MPNWCFAGVRVDGPKDKVRKPKRKAWRFLSPTTHKGFTSPNAISFELIGTLNIMLTFDPC